MHELFEAQVAAHPNTIAVVSGSTRLTYAELDRRSNQLAHYLLSLGVLPEEKVGVCFERGVGMVVSLLGVMKAGCAYVPLDPHDSLARLQYMFVDAEPSAILTSEAIRDELPAVSRLRIVALDDPRDRAAIDASSDDVPMLGDGDSRRLAYIMYTSGSTGQPKGVMIEHRSIVRLVLNNTFAQIGSEHIVAHCANPAFDASTWEIWGALLNGARIVIVPQTILLEPHAFRRLLIAEKVTSLWLTVGLFNVLVEQLQNEFGHLEHLIIGGDALDTKSVARLANGKHPPRHFINGYGPTESTTFAATFNIRKVSERARTIPIGRPIANTSIYILSSELEPVPVGVTGEIVIGGAGVARGYLNQAELTAQHFVQDAFSADRTARMYRTGDLGRFLSDGNIEFVGRMDNQVKIRGFRVEPGEVEAQLSQLPGVSLAAVIARDDNCGTKSLVAYVTPNDGVELSVDALHSSLTRVLPDYMVPKSIVVIPCLPLTRNGKIDRSQLPIPESSGISVNSFDPPTGSLEVAVASIWQECLMVDRVGRQDNFFDLGGHSLLAVQIASRVDQILGIQIAIRTLFAFPTLALFSAQIQNQSSTPDTLVSIRTGGRENPLFFVHPAGGRWLTQACWLDGFPLNCQYTGSPQEA